MSERFCALRRYLVMRWAIGLSALAGVLVCAHATARAGAVAGVALDKHTYETLAGVTVVATSPELKGVTHAEITDESGRYAMHALPSGIYTVTFYYADITYRRDSIQVNAERTTYVFALLDTNVFTCCLGCFGWGPPPMLDTTSTDQGFEREGEALFRFPAHDRGRPGASYYVDGFLCPTTAPALPDLLVDEYVELWGGFSAQRGPATPMIHVSTPKGTNEHHGTVLARGRRGELEVAGRLGGPLVKDRLWYTAAAAPRVHDAGLRLPRLASLWYAHAPEHQGGVVLLGDAEKDVDLVTSRPIQRRTNGATAQWVSKLDNNRLEIGAGLAYHRSEERMEQRRVFEQRHRASVHVVKRWEGIGYHRSRAGAHAGGSQLSDNVLRFEAETTDFAAFVQDSWSLYPNHTFNAGLRYDQQRVDYGGPAKIREYSGVSPRVGYIYDWTKEGLSKVYIHYGRYRELVSHDTPVPAVTDEVIAGVEYEVTERMPVGIAIRNATTEAGVRVTWQRDTGKLRWRARYDATWPKDQAVDHDVELDVLWELDTCITDNWWLGARLRLLDEQSSNLHLGYRVEINDGDPLDLFIDVLDVLDQPSARLGARWSF